MKILIVGGTGLISTVTTRILLERGHAITLFNRNQTVTRFDGHVHRVSGDRREHAAFEAKVAMLGDFDCVIDMVGFTPADAESAARAFRGRCGHYIFCSTVDVYAKTSAGFPVKEDRALEPVGAYGKDKARGEMILAAASKREGLNLTIIRPATIIGEGSAPSHTFGRGTGFLDRIRKGKPVVVHGDGSSVWCWCHCDDAGAAFANAAGNPAAFGNSYHVAGEEWMTWARYYACVAEALGAPQPDIVRIPTEVLAQIAPDRAKPSVENYQYNNMFDTSAAWADLGFRYTVPVTEAVKRTYGWLAANGRVVNSDEDSFEDSLIASWRALIGGWRAQSK
ncbi:MAG: NAD-dependent epimerase/dehydratase family protein [Thermoflexales bacterium]